VKTVKQNTLQLFSVLRHTDEAFKRHFSTDFCRQNALYIKGIQKAAMHAYYYAHISIIQVIFSVKYKKNSLAEAKL